MLQLIERIIRNVLTSLYQPFWFAVLAAVLIMFFYMSAKKEGIKPLIKKWIDEFKTSRKFRTVFLFSFFVVMILFRTLINRNMYLNPVDDIIGPWLIWNRNGEFTTEAIENTVLFMPFTFLLFCSFRERVLGENIKLSKVLLKSLSIGFLLSLFIELAQLFLRVGSFQISDLFHNTLGAVIGGIIYYIVVKIKNKSSGSQR